MSDMSARKMLKQPFMMRWLFSVIVAWGVAYGLYFILLIIMDTVVGGRQIEFQSLFGSRRDLLVQMLQIVMDSAWIVLPVVTVITLVPGALSRGAWVKALFLVILGVFVLVFVLKALSVSGFQIFTFAGALFCAPLVAWLMTRVHRHV